MNQPDPAVLQQRIRDHHETLLERFRQEFGRPLTPSIYTDKVALSIIKAVCPVMAEQRVNLEVAMDYIKALEDQCMNLSIRISKLETIHP